MKRLVDLHVLHIVDGLMSSKLLDTSRKPTDARYTRLTKMITKNTSVLPLPVSISINVPGVKSLGITHANDKGSYNFDEEDMLFLIQVTDEFTRKYPQASSLSAEPLQHVRGTSSQWILRLSYIAVET